MAFHRAGSDGENDGDFRIGFSRAQPVANLVFPTGESGMGGGNGGDGRKRTDRDAAFTLPSRWDEDGGAGGSR